MLRNLTVYIEVAQQDFTESVRCGFIVAEDESGKETYHNDVIDNSEYPSIKALIDDVAGIFRISREEIVLG